MIEDPLTDPITHDFPCEGSHGERCPLSLDTRYSAREGAGPQRVYPPGNWFAPPVAIRAVVEATKLLKPLVQS